MYEESFHCTNLGIQLKPVIRRYMSQAALRLCVHCKHQNEYDYTSGDPAPRPSSESLEAKV